MKRMSALKSSEHGLSTAGSSSGSSSASYSVSVASSSYLERSSGSNTSNILAPSFSACPFPLSDSSCIALGVLVAPVDHLLPEPLFQIPLAHPEKVHPEGFHPIVWLKHFLLILFLFRFQIHHTLGLLLLVHQKPETPETSSVSSSFSVTSSGSETFNSSAPVFSACPAFFCFPSHLALRRLLVALLDHPLVVPQL